MAMRRATTRFTSLAVAVLLPIALAARAVSPEWISQGELYPRVLQDGSLFGSSIYVNGNELAVGAPYRNDGVLAASGAVEVWRRDGGSWHFAENVVLENPAADAFFGFAVAIDGDRLYAGAPGYAGDAGDLPNSGLVNYLQYFPDESDPWSSIGGIGGAEGDRTGWSIAYDRELLAVGSPGPCETCGSGSARAGKVMIAFDGDDPSTWANLYPLSDAHEGDHFGHSVAVYRSPDPLQPDLAVVGAPFHDSGGPFSGAAYVFANSTHVADGWLQVAELTAPDPAAQEMFGLSVAAGPGRVFVGAPGRDVPGASPPVVDVGSVFAFEPDGAGSWQLQSEVFMSGPASGDRFGTAVAYDAERGWLVAGAPDRVKDVFGGTGQTGVAAVFRNVSCGLGEYCWSEVAELFSHDQLSIGQYAGASVAVADGRVYVGAPYYDANPNNGVSDSGRVLVFIDDHIFDDGFDGGAE